MESASTAAHNPEYRMNSAAAVLSLADWYALRVLSNYRLFLLIGITALFYLNPNPSILGQRSSFIFHACLIAYLMFGMVFNHLIRIRKPSLETQFYLQAYIDIIFITLLMYASGGIQSGLGMLLVVNIAIIGLFAQPRYTFLFAAIATTAVLTQELYSSLLTSMTHNSLVKTGVTGMALFAAAYITSMVFQRRVLGKFDTDRVVRDADMIAQLNERIIHHIDSGILFVDSLHNVRLFNNRAAVFFAIDSDQDNKSLQEFSPELFQKYKVWLINPNASDSAFHHKSSNFELLPHFNKISDFGTLISIEDHGHISQQVQQLKLASLGSLTASIAHQIRNPLSAINNSVQLIEESTTLDKSDKRLLNIAQRNCKRINRIIEDILQLSKREKSTPETIHLDTFIKCFCEKFIEEFNSSPLEFDIHIREGQLIEFDPSHLEQVLATLCSNSVTHNKKQETPLVIQIHSLDSSSSGKDGIKISDNGCGIELKKNDDIFEPFFTTSLTGTGLGLFITKELCEINLAQIMTQDSTDGACFKIFFNNSTMNT